MKTIEFVNVSYTYGTQLALSPLSITFEEGKITAIIGRSGSGKSTVMRLINGLLKPLTGEVLAFGKPLDYNNIFPVRLKMGYMVQGTGLFPHLTVEQNIAVGGRIAKMSVRSSRVDELMNLVSLPPTYKAKYPHELSGGEQQRVGLCRALYLDPPILLMDEPLGSLDPVTRHEIQKQLKQLQELSPRTIVFVTHDMREAHRLGQRLLVLDKGAVQQYDNAKTVLDQPANAAVLSLIESSAW